MNASTRRVFPRSAQTLLLRALRDYPVAVVTGPRQSGKSTLIKHALPDWLRVSLEDVDLREFARRDGRGFLRQYPAPLIIDEAQHVPDLFSYIQTQVDESGLMGQYVLSGSQQFSLLSGVTQSLAGRASLIELPPLRLQEIAAGMGRPKSLYPTIWQGAYPAVLARGLDPVGYFADYVSSYLERDLRSLSAVHDLGSFQRFMRLCAARTGQLLNLNGLANDCGISQPTADKWINLLETSYVVKRVSPYFRNFGKRLVKAPKLYFCDTGLCCWLLGIQSPAQLETHYARGAIFETWVVGEALKWRAARGDRSPIYFWRDNIGNEVDVLLEQGGTITLVEVKSGQTYQDEWRKPLTTVARHMGEPVRTALVYGGDLPQQRSDGTAVIPWHQLCLAG
jgi:uncharacterized protein